MQGRVESHDDRIRDRTRSARIYAYAALGSAVVTLVLYLLG